MGSAGTSFRMALSFSGSVVGVGRAKANDADRRAARMMEERMLIVSEGRVDRDAQSERPVVAADTSPKSNVQQRLSKKKNASEV